MIIEGSLSVKAVIENGRHKLHKLYLGDYKHSKDTNYLIHLAKKHNLELEFVSKEKCEELAFGKTHGGVLLECEPRSYQAVSDLPIGKNSLILLIEGVEDPFNLGMMIRTAFIMGANAIITPNRPMHHNEATLIKASAGASEKLVWVASDDLESCLRYLKSNHYRVFSALRNNESQSIHETTFSSSCVIAIGGEMRGLSKQVISASDSFVYIPYGFDAKIALSAVSAASMFLYEVNKQRIK